MIPHRENEKNHVASINTIILVKTMAKACEKYNKTIFLYTAPIVLNVVSNTVFEVICSTTSGIYIDR